MTSQSAPADKPYRWRAGLFWRWMAEQRGETAARVCPSEPDWPIPAKRPLACGHREFECPGHTVVGTARPPYGSTWRKPT